MALLYILAASCMLCSAAAGVCNCTNNTDTAEGYYSKITAKDTCECAAKCTADKNCTFANYVMCDAERPQRHDNCACYLNNADHLIKARGIEFRGEALCFPDGRPAPPSPAPPRPREWECHSKFQSTSSRDLRISDSMPCDNIKDCQDGCTLMTPLCVAVNWNEAKKECHAKVGNFTHTD